MPREHRKRGRRHKKGDERAENDHNEEFKLSAEELEAQPRAGPSWIRQREEGAEDEVDPNAPFGYVNPDVKAYFKTVDEKLREWQGMRDETLDEGLDVEPNEERRLFVMAALSEMSGKEKQLATDPDCSNVLERMMYSMDDFVKRVFMDRLAGSYVQLSKHRFGSHVVQTLLSTAKSTVDREMKGTVALPPQEDSELGSLPTMIDEILALSEELFSSLTTLLVDPFASHVLRALFLLLCPNLLDEGTQSTKSSILRSKKSAKHRAKQGSMKTVFTSQGDDGEAGTATGYILPPAQFNELAKRFVSTVRETSSANEVRALAADSTGCPILTLLLELEASQGSSNEEGSLLDSVLHGLVTQVKHEETDIEASDYVMTLLREPVASHLLEGLVSLSPLPVLNMLWTLYFHEKLRKLAIHPVANFVLARAVNRLDGNQLLSAINELDYDTWSKIMKNSRTGVLKTFIDRSAALRECEDVISKVVLELFELAESQTLQPFVPCVMFLKAYGEYQSSPNESQKRSSPDPTIQGSLLLQSLVRLSEPHNACVTESLTSLPIDDLISLCHNGISSRVVDAFLDSPSVPTRAKRKLLLSFIGHYHQLVDDRVGSRVGDRCWASADPYLKEKIARSLIPHERILLGSQYGRFFGRKLQLQVLKKEPESWKGLQAKVTESQSISSATPAVDVGSAKVVHQADDASRKHKKRKRENKEADEIEKLFSSKLGKKVKKGSLVPSSIVDSQDSFTSKPREISENNDMDGVMAAIRSAPKDLKSGRRSKV